MNENDYHLQGGPKARGAPGPELWVPDETACLPEQLFVATGRGVRRYVGGTRYGVRRSRREVWNSVV